MERVGWDGAQRNPSFREDDAMASLHSTPRPLATADQAARSYPLPRNPAMRSTASSSTGRSAV